MADKTFKCRFGCGHEAGQASALKPHYKDAHKRAYEKWVAEKQERRAASNAEQEPAEQADAETTFLVELTAKFQQKVDADELDREAFGRGLAFLGSRFGPDLAAE